MRLTIGLLTCILLVLPLLTHGQVTDFSAEIYQDSAGNELQYRILKPANYDSTKSYPLVLFLHGAGERGSDNFSQLKWGVSHFADPQFREQYPAFVVAPQVPKNQTWAGLSLEKHSNHSNPLSEQPTQPMQLTISLLDKLEQQYNIDLARMYVTGISMGGFGTFDIIQRMPNKFAAAVPICGGGDVSKAFLLQDMPLWVFHGSQDEVVAPEYSRNLVSAIRIAGGSPGYTEYPDAGHIGAWVQAYSNPHLYKWMFSKSLDENKEELNKLQE